MQRAHSGYRFITRRPSAEILDGKMPDGMGQTGAGGMAGGAGLPVGNLAAASLILAGGYAMLRRR